MEPTPEDCDNLAAKLEDLVAELNEGEREALARVIHFAAVAAEESEVSGYAYTAFETGLGAALGRAALGRAVGLESG